MECPQCKTYNAPQTTHCTNCGRQLSSGNSPVAGFRPIGSVSPTPAQPSQTSYSSSVSSPSTYTPGPTSYYSGSTQSPQQTTGNRVSDGYGRRDNQSGSYSQSATSYGATGQEDAYMRSTYQENNWRGNTPVNIKPTSYDQYQEYGQSSDSYNSYGQNIGGHGTSSYSQSSYGYNDPMYGQPQGGYGDPGGFTGYINCPNCKAIVPSTATTCFSCGLPLSMTGLFSDKDKTTTLILCLAVGVLGGHQFYVGNTGKGVLYLFTGGLLGIGVIIDFVNILNGSFTDSFGRRLRQS